MQKSKIVVTAGLLILAGSAAAIAAVGDSGWHGERWGRRGGGDLMRMDANKDGTLTLEEFLGRRESRFAELDANKDGAISPEEVVAPMKERVAFRDKRMMKSLDADGDGKISKTEFESGTRERFADRDLDSDGKITREDMPPRWHNRGERGDRGDRRAEAEQGAAPEAGKEEHGKGRRFGRGPMTLDRMLERTGERFQDLDKNGDGFIAAQELSASHEEQMAYQVKKLMHRLDKDHDGKVTKDEYTARAKARFANLDLDGDGKITVADLPPGMAKRWGKSRE